MAKSKKEGLRAAPNGNDDYRDQGPRDTFVPPARENHKNRSGIGLFVWTLSDESG